MGSTCSNEKKATKVSPPPPPPEDSAAQKAKDQAAALANARAQQFKEQAAKISQRIDILVTAVRKEEEQAWAILVNSSRTSLDDAQRDTLDRQSREAARDQCLAIVRQALATVQEREASARKSLEEEEELCFQQCARQQQCEFDPLERKHRFLVEERAILAKSDSFITPERLSSTTNSLHDNGGKAPAAPANTTPTGAHVQQRRSVWDRLVMPLKGKSMQRRDMPLLVERLAHMDVHTRVLAELAALHSQGEHKETSSFKSKTKRGAYEQEFTTDGANSFAGCNEHLIGRDRSRSHGSSSKVGNTAFSRSVSVCSRGCGSRSQSPESARTFHDGHSHHSASQQPSAWARDHSSRWNFLEDSKVIPRFVPRLHKDPVPGPGAYDPPILHSVATTR